MPELKFLIDRSKELHTALHNPKARTSAEEDVYRFARSSVVADRDLPASTILTERDIWVRRPGSGPIAASCYDKLLGKKLKIPKKFNDTLDWHDIE